MKILVLEDDPHVRAFICEALSKVGYNVDVAERGEEALRKYRECGPYAVVLSDVAHPGPSGIEVSQAILNQNPKQAVGLVTSNPVLSNPVLSKPFTLEALLQFVAKLAST